MNGWEAGWLGTQTHRHKPEPWDRIAPQDRMYDLARLDRFIRKNILITVEQSRKYNSA